MVRVGRRMAQRCVHMTQQYCERLPAKTWLLHSSTVATVQCSNAPGGPAVLPA